MWGGQNVVGKSSKRAGELDCSIANRVRMERMRLRMSQTDLGARLGVTFQQIQKYEKGVNRIGAGRLLEIAAIFGVPVQALFPTIKDANTATKQSQQGLDEFAELRITADSMRLCRAFQQIKDARVRKKIIALVEIIEHDDGTLPDENVEHDG
jgi:transcriptional regulator with XRE-family HTH domain